MEMGDNTDRGIEERIELLKKEVDALQVNITNQKPRWYQHIPIWVSSLALIFSFGTTYVSHNRADAQDIQNTKAELRAIIQRLTYLPKEYYDISKKYSIDQNASMTMMTIGSSMNQETDLLARQAVELVKKLPEERVSPTEYSSIAQTLSQIGDYEGAKEFYGNALKFSRNSMDKVIALRGNAHLMFITNSLDKGRGDFQRALNVFLESSDHDKYMLASMNIRTELLWALAEAGIVSYPLPESGTAPYSLAETHIANAERYLDGLQRGPATDGLQKDINQIKREIESIKERQKKPIASTGMNPPKTRPAGGSIKPKPLHSGQKPLRRKTPRKHRP